MRDLDQNSSTISGFRVAAAGSAMGQVDQNLNALLNDLVTLLATDAGHKADTAGIVLEGGIIKTLRRR